MTIRNNIFKRVTAIVLALAVFIVTLPTTALFVGAATQDSYYNRVVDSNTMDGWTEYFDLNNLTTQNAGGVWTDKSVFTDVPESFPDDVTMVDKDKNFLTALSALAANKEVVGYSTVPTDTVFILDLSNSMSSASVTDLVDATNQAIASLQEMNNNNRVGVVLYSGASTDRTYDNAVARLMPIDRYTTTNRDGKFIEYTGGTVRLVRSGNRVQVSGSNGAVTSESKAHSGATYIQAGLWEAWQMFDEVPDSDIVIGDNNWQKGEARMPIVVLMSDGAPTLGTSYYADVENSTYGTGNQNRTKANVGSGNETNITTGQGFLVQLTASYIKNQIENKYKVHEKDGAGRSLFYTLGFNINSLEGTARTVATSVLNPDASTATDSLWNTYNRLSGSNTMSVTAGGRTSGTTTVTVSKNSFVTSKSYVDEYFSASGDGLTEAFKDIVEEIVLQSRYYPTHLEGGSPDFSGYVEFTDELGEYMQVKHINGFLLGDVLFDGHMMASKLNDSTSDGLGSINNPTELGDEFIRAVKTRLGIDNTAEAQALVAEAYRSEQICYITDNRGNVEKWSNYIGWYADADGKYLGHWNENPAQAVPAGAVYKMKSYGFLGETSGSIKNSDMMYMSVQVKTDIATGKETVSWRIPAALVPMVTYLVEVDGTSVDKAENVRVSVEDKNVTPIRLVYETGLRSDLNEFNITRITDEEHIASDKHTRIFWNNYFNIEGDSHDRHITAMSEFTPNKENERFYYTFDSAVHKLVDAQNEEYALVGENEGLDPENKTYYHRRYIFTDDSDTPIFFYEQMSKASVQAALANGFDDDFESLEHETIGAWVVPAGTPARELQMYDKKKTENPTKSAEMVFHPYLTEQNNMVYVDMNLGNNGLLSVTPATGIKISKTVDIFEDGTSDTFKFRITAQTSGTFDSWITALDATPSGEATPVTLRNGVYEFEMKKDQTFWLSGLSANTAYTVEEISDNDDYKIKSVHVNGASTGKAATGTITQYHIDDIDFVNTAVGEGDLVITKQVIDANGNTVDINDSVTFTAEVSLTNADGEPVSGTFDANNAAGEFTVPASGIFTVTLKEGESFILRKISEETRYTVTEINIPQGFALNTEKSKLSGIIDTTANDQALIVNNYLPVFTDGRNVSVVIGKQISGNRTNWLNGESYEFILERLNGTSPATEVFRTEINADNTTKSVRHTLQTEDFTTEGTYYFTITEKVGTQGGITYDTAARRFSIDVADADMDGDLEIVSVKNVLNTVVSQTGNNYTVNLDFNNVYQPTGSDTITINVEKHMQGDYRLNGFQFALYDSEDIANADEVIRSTVTDIEGKASFSLTYAPNFATTEGTVYTYWMAEINTGNPNITYDDTVYKVEVTVKDNGDGTISASPVISGIAQGQSNPTFTNIFTPSESAYVTFTANKTIEGDRALNANEFDFVIEAITQGAPMPANTTVHNAANGAVVFDTIEFDTVGTYKYKIYESSANKIGGFTYDNRFYEITVTVVDNGNATLSATVSRVVKDNESDSGRTLGVNELISFVNTYDATDAKVTFSGTKVLTGKTLQDDEFEFVLTPTGNTRLPAGYDATVKNIGTSFKFNELTYDKAGVYTYTITEKGQDNANYNFDESVYQVTVTVTDNSVGRLSARVTMLKNGLPSSEIVFNNSFVPTPITFDISGTFGGEKQLEGRPAVDGEFEFILINAINGQQIGETVKNIFNGTKHTFNFPAVTLPEAGIYHYKITEVAGDEKGVSYDNTSYHIRLSVEQGDNGLLNITDQRLYKGTVTVEDVDGVLTEVTGYENITSLGTNGIIFNNSYNPDPAYVTLEATKTLTGRDLIDGEFKFDLYKTDNTYNYDGKTPVQNDVVLSLNDDGSGTVRFMTLGFDQVGEYYYVVIEDELDEKGIVSDKTEYKVKITVSDNHDGNLVANIEVNDTAITNNTSEVIKFTNAYSVESNYINIKGLKKLAGRTLVDEEFTFALYKENGELIEQTQNDQNGKIEFTPINVEQEGEYTYIVKEIAGNEEGMVYDQTVYTVIVKVTDSLDGTLDVEYTYLADNVQKDGIVFNNSYKIPEIPKTGVDSSHIIFLVALLFVSGGAVTGLTIYNIKKNK